MKTESYTDTISGEELHIQISEVGTTRYYKKSGAMHLRHRVDGPAIIYSDGDTTWQRNGRTHRMDGPAIDHRGDTAWYINGVYLNQRELQRELNFLKQ